MKICFALYSVLTSGPYFRTVLPDHRSSDCRLGPGPIKMKTELSFSLGITVVNEVGVDPGIDHMLAMELFHELQESGEEIKSFVSFCGGLPAPEASNNPLGYKFSWSPRGVLLNTVSGAQWLHSNKTDGIAPGGDIICKPYQFDGRDSEVKEPFIY